MRGIYRYVRRRPYDQRWGERCRMIGTGYRGNATAGAAAISMQSLR